jgi:hypothetical protein
MEKELKNYKNIHHNKIGLVVVLGPSLNEHLEDIKKLNDEENLIIYTCNMFDRMIDINPNYWLVCAPMKPMYIKNAYNRINNKKSTFLFAHRIPGFSKEDAKNFLTCDYIPVSDVYQDPESLQQTFAKYTKGETYGPVDTVLLHLVSLSIFNGCKKVYIVGADLDYKKGYVKNGVHKEGERMGLHFMNTSAKNRTIEYMKKINNSAKKIGVEIYTLNKTSPLIEVFECKNINNLKNDIK